jgi:hypothetical protein
LNNPKEGLTISSALADAKKDLAALDTVRKEIETRIE